MSSCLALGVSDSLRSMDALVKSLANHIITAQTFHLEYDDKDTFFLTVPQDDDDNDDDFCEKETTSYVRTCVVFYVY